MSEKITNIVGVPFKRYVKDQIFTRAYQSSTFDRNEDQVMYLANKNCWIRMASFVSVVDPIGQSSDELARNWVLMGGTSYYTPDDQGIYTKNNLRSGIELSNPVNITNNSAYGLGGTNQQGFRPMPGITSATIEHAGTAGSLRIANIKFKVWNREQLDIIDTLYFRLGYSCLIEWGHTSYIDNKTKKLQNLIFPLDIFNTKDETLKTKEGIARKINEKRIETSGNYDGMYGLISNYEWNQSSDGGYDCNVKLTGLGSVIDSLKINQSYSMPGDAYQAAAQSSNNNVVQAVGTTPAPQQYPKDPFVTKDEKFIIYPNEGRKIVLGSDAVLFNWNYAFTNKPALIQYSFITKDNQKITGVNSDTQKLISGRANLSLVRVTENSKQYLALKDNSGDYINRDFTKIDFIAKSEDGFIPTLTKFKDQDTISFTQRFKLKETEEFEYDTGKTQRVLGTGAASQYRDEKIIDTAVCEEIEVEITVPRSDLKYINLTIISQAELSNYDKDAKNITQPVLREFYYKYLTTQFNDTSKRQTVGDNEKTKGITVTISDVTPVQKDNTLNISANFKITDNQTGNRGGARVEVLEKAIQQLYTSLEISKNSLQARDALSITKLENDVTSLASINFNTIKASGYGPLNIASVNYVFDLQKIINPSNVDPDAAQNALDVPQDTLPKVVMSNIDKFLIELRDKANELGGTIGGEVNLKEFIENQLKNGVLDPTRIKTAGNILPQTSKELTLLSKEDLLGAYVKKGFNSELLSGEIEFTNKVPDVNFDKLFTAYISGISDVDGQGTTSKFTYIKLGLLLYYINNSSLLYETDTQDNPSGTENTTAKQIKKPIVYLDFNPETNFCLTTKYHFSVDPGVCLVQVNISQEGYDALFPNIKLGDANKFQVSLDNVSRFIKTDFNEGSGVRESRAKLMNLGVNIDYIINLLQSQASNNPNSDVYLRSFLEILMEDINKSLGNINKFRVGYYDDGNTVRIYDDQVIAPPLDQALINGKPDPKNPLEDSSGALLPIGLPVFGRTSIIRSLNIKTEVSTAMGRQIAIGAQAGNFGALNTDSSAFGNLNVKLIDRIMPAKEESANPDKKTEKSTADESSAEIFNDHLITIYNKQRYNKANVDIAKNYYSTAANKLKASRNSTKSRVVLPISVNLSLDGISGLSLLEGFTIPNDVLPKQYLDEQGNTRVGFAIAGLNHSIDNNQWTTSIRGQMINLLNPVNVISSEFGETSVGAGGAPPRGSYSQVPSGPPVPIGENPLLKNQQFLNKVGEIARKYGFNPEEMLKCFHAESGISTTAQNWQGIKGVTSGPNRYRLVAAGLMQWTYASGFVNYTSSKKYGVKTLFDILKLSGLQQLEMADEYFANSRVYINRMSKDERSSFFGLYLLVFFPTLAGKPDSTIAKSNVSAEEISRQNAGIAKAAGKTPGTPLTKGDFRVYCAKTFNRKLPAGLKFS